MATNLLAGLDSNLELLSERAREEAAIDLAAGRPVVAWRDGALVADTADSAGNIVTSLLPSETDAALGARHPKRKLALG